MRAKLIALSYFAAVAAFEVTQSQAGDLKIVSWLPEEVDFWNKVAIPAFNAAHPNIHVQYSATEPSEYAAKLGDDLQSRDGADLVFCQPFDASLELYNQHRLLALNEFSFLNKYSDAAKAGWSTDDGKVTYCLPVAGIIHGFIYNKEAFQRIGASEPATLADFHTLLELLKKDGTYTPLVMGTADQWEAATVGFQNIGPNFWKGETGRVNLITGKEKFTDQQYVAVFRELAHWMPYLGEKFSTQSYVDSQNLFLQGKGAIYPAGSWEIPLFRTQAKFALGAFKPPMPPGSDDCYIADHSDFGIGINSASANKSDAATFLEWITTAEFGQLYANTFPGAFPFSSDPIKIDEPLAATFLSWRQTCRSTIRTGYQILSRRNPSLENRLWEISAQVVEYRLSPEAAASEAQRTLQESFPAKR